MVEMALGIGISSDGGKLETLKKLLAPDVDLLLIHSERELREVLISKRPIVAYISELGLEASVSQLSELVHQSQKSIEIVAELTDLFSIVESLNEERVRRVVSPTADAEEIAKEIRYVLKHRPSGKVDQEARMGVLSGLVSVLDEYSESSTMSEFFSDAESNAASVAATSSIPFGWLERFATRLAITGFAVLSPEEIDVLVAGELEKPEYEFSFKRALLSAARWPRLLPKLSGVADMLERSSSGTGDIQSRSTEKGVFSELLKPILIWSLNASQGLSTSELSGILRRKFPSISDSVFEAFSKLKLPIVKTVKLNHDEVCEGMVLTEPLMAPDGRVALKAGSRIDTKGHVMLQRVAAANHACKQVHTRVSVAATSVARQADSSEDSLDVFGTFDGDSGQSECRIRDGS